MVESLRMKTEMGEAVVITRFPAYGNDTTGDYCSQEKAATAVSVRRTGLVCATSRLSAVVPSACITLRIFVSFSLNILRYVVYRI